MQEGERGESGNRGGGGTMGQERREVHVTGGNHEGKKGSVSISVETEVNYRHAGRKKIGRKERNNIESGRGKQELL